MRLVTWNVNGLRACLGKGFLDFFQRVDADVVCLQETKLQPGQLTLELEEYLDQEICRTAPLSEAPEDSGAIDSSIRTAAA